MFVFFDIGSTLIEGPPVGPARRLAEALGLPAERRSDLERLLFRQPAENAAELAEHIARQFAIDTAYTLDAVSALWQAQLEETVVLPGAVEIIDALAAAGIRRGYISNIWPPFYQGFVRFFPAEARDCPNFLSFRLGLSKPDTAFYRTALETIGVRPEDVVMVGDTYGNDIAPCKELGMKTVWLLHRPNKERNHLVAVLNGLAKSPDLTLSSIAELRLEHLMGFFH